MTAVSDAGATASELHTAAIRMLRGLRRVDVEMGIGSARASALSVVVFGGPISIGRLALVEQVRGPTMTRVVDRLVRDGLVVRQRDSDDRRTVVVAPTPKGIRLLETGRRRRVASLARALEKLSDADLRAVGRAAQVLAKLDW